MSRPRHFALVLLIVAILALWSTGIALVLETAWHHVFIIFAGTCLTLFALHYFYGKKWLISRLDARPTNKPILKELVKRAKIEGDVNFYVTRSFENANAFAVSYSEEQTIFLTPEVWQADKKLLAPIVAHELAHVKNGDSLIAGFTSAFEKIIGRFSNLWFLLLMGGPLGWIILLFFWPLLLFVQLWSHVTLFVYRLLASPLRQKREFEADRLAASWTSPELTRRALKAVDSYNSHWLKDIFSNQGNPLSTHPPLKERIQRLKGMTSS